METATSPSVKFSSMTTTYCSTVSNAPSSVSTVTELFPLPGVTVISVISPISPAWVPSTAVTSAPSSYGKCATISFVSLSTTSESFEWYWSGSSSASTRTFEPSCSVSCVAPPLTLCLPAIFPRRLSADSASMGVSARRPPSSGKTRKYSSRSVNARMSNIPMGRASSEIASPLTSTVSWLSA